MSKAFPLEVKKSGRGRPRKEGERYPSGRRLRGKDGAIPEPPTPEAQRHREAGADLSALYEVAREDPLDYAYQRGWIAEGERHAGRTFERLFRFSQQGGRGGGGITIDLEAALIFKDPEDPIAAEEATEDWSLRLLSNKEIEALWDSVFSVSEAGEEQERVRPRCSETCACTERQAAMCAKWRAVKDALTTEERREVFAVCVRKVWPQWLIQRAQGEVIHAKAEAEGRALRDEEAHLIARKFLPSLVRQRALLIGALRAISGAIRGGVQPAELPFGETIIEPEPPPYRPISPTRVIGQEGVTNYIDQDGEPWFVVEKRRAR